MATNQTERQLRAVIYTRISHDPSGKAEGVTRQQEACRKLAAELGWRIVGVKTDDDRTAIGKSGDRARRPAYAELLDMLSAREVDAVLVWHTDRLYRQARDLEPLIDIVERTHVVIRPVKQGELDLATASGRMVARILASVSTHEVEHAVERMKAKHEANRRAGINHGGPRTFGFRAVKPKAVKDQAPQVPKVDPREAALIREAANAVLAYAADPATGRTLTGICRDWNERKIPTPRGKAWTIQSLRGVLLSPRIAGRIAHKGEDAGPAQWDAIVDYDVWLALRNVLKDPSRRRGSGGDDDRQPKYLGSGLYRCGRDGCGAVVRPGGARAGQRQQYRCTSSAHLIRTAEPVDDFVERVIVARLCREDARAAFSAPVEAPQAGVSAEDLNARHATLTARLEALAETFAEDDEADPMEYRTASRKIKERIAAVEQEITEAAAAAASAAAPGPLDSIDLPELVRRHEADSDDALVWWRQRYPLERRRKILTLLAEVTLMPGRRGRPLGVAAGGLDPASVRIDWKGNC
ncbi:MULTISPECIES: recombinase family protein [Streptomyces]|uniref:Recombinase n=1 Tax=Streptomyces pseudovenezuelae TaxID=67350 RepID=A0A124H9J4_9ACTN|nr:MULTISPECIES: recombinase family protein [Streptomyces]KUM85176.1 recombinase [Streptomyces pseudovenezuelae]